MQGIRVTFDGGRLVEIFFRVHVIGRAIVVLPTEAGLSDGDC